MNNSPGMFASLLRANECSDEMGYEHTVIRCWFDNTLFHHILMVNGSWWWMCSDCREMHAYTKQLGIPYGTGKCSLCEYIKVVWEGFREKLPSRR